MRAIPTRTDPLTRATMPAITSTAAMIHKMVSVLPPPFAASIPITPSMSPPFILGNYRRGAARSLTQQGRPRGDYPQAGGPVASLSVSLLTAGRDAPLDRRHAEVLDNLGVFRAAP